MFFQVRIDFYTLYPNAKNPDEVFPTLRVKLYQLFNAKKSRDEFVVTVNKLQQSDSEDQKNLGGLLAIVNLINIGNCKSETSQWRPNFSEIRANFILLVTSISHINNEIKKLIERKEKHDSPLQPLIIAIGEEYTTVTQYSVYFN